MPFVSYQPVSVKAPGSSATTACDKLGNPGIVLADKGAFSITFSASDVIQNSSNLKGPLVGNIECSVFEAADVDVNGPKAGAVSLQDFVLPHADLGSKVAPTFSTEAFPKGTYQILCFQDLTGNGSPHMGDPVTLPIGSFPLACNLNPISVQFAHPRSRALTCVLGRLP